MLSARRPQKWQSCMHEKDSSNTKFETLIGTDTIIIHVFGEVRSSLSAICFALNYTLKAVIGISESGRFSMVLVVSGLLFFPAFDVE